jgi:hypothetical protein
MEPAGDTAHRDEGRPGAASDEEAAGLRELLTATERHFPEFAFRTMPIDSLTTTDRQMLSELFDASFRDANQAHLDKLLGQLRTVSVALCGKKPAGFTMSDVRIMDLPRLPDQVVMLGGLTCVVPEFHRRGLMMDLGSRNLIETTPQWGQRALICGRYVHPAVYKRVVSAREQGVPRPGVRPTAWQQEVGRAIADAYEVEDFDAETFVCRGSGRPIGDPIIDLQLEPEDWEAFRHVDDDRGDSLLGIMWMPDAPAGWA